MFFSLFPEPLFWVLRMQESGHIADWNKEHPSDAVTVRDRFVELDGAW